MHGILVILLLSCGWAFATESPFPKTFPYCQGEGCGCTRKPTAREKVALYEKMDEASKRVGIINVGDKAKVVGTFTLVTKPGRAKVFEVGDPSLGVKVGDEIMPLLYMGEGYYLIWKDGKQLSDRGLKSRHRIKWEVLEPYKAESWYKIQRGGLVGFTKSFPFEGCLE